MEKLGYQPPSDAAKEPETVEESDYNAGCFPAVSGLLLAVASGIFAGLVWMTGQGWTKELVAGGLGIFTCVGGWTLAILTLRRKRGAASGIFVVLTLLPSSFSLGIWIMHLFR